MHELRETDEEEDEHAWAHVERRMMRRRRIRMRWHIEQHPR
jgi:hypothetical protein